MIKPAMNALGVMLHHFHDDFHPKGQGAITAEELNELIVRHGPENFLPARTWMNRALSGTLKDNQCCLTFDDGLRCQFDIALPVLEKYGLTAFWFIYTSIFDGVLERFEIYRYFRTVKFTCIDDFYDAFDATIHASPYAHEVFTKEREIEARTYKPELEFFSARDRLFRHTRDNILGKERYNEIMDTMVGEENWNKNEIISRLWMTSCQIKRLHDQGHLIGLHTHSHPMQIDRLSKQEQYEEYAKNGEILQNITGAKPIVMAHPCNIYNDDTLAVLKELGIILGFSARPHGDLSNLLKMPRLEHGTFLHNLRA